MTSILKLRATLIILAAAATAACHRGAAPASSASSDAASAPAATRYEDHIWAGGIAPPGDEPRNPRPEDKASATDGERLFASMNCDGCHGAGGSGWIGPSLADGRWRYGGRDEEIFSSIFYGRPKGMPAYGGVLGQDGVWRLVSYLKSLPRPDVVPTQSWIDSKQDAAGAVPPQANAEAAPPTGGRPSELESSMQTNGCAACHALDRKIVGPAFSEVAAKYRGQPDAEQRLAASVKNGSVGVWGNIPMPANSALDDEVLGRIVRQIVSLK